EKPFVSIVLPVYNHVEFLPLAIESSLRQTYPFFELIIVDDGSDENLLSTVEKYLEDARVKFIRQKHGGLPKALNTGFSIAQGEYFCWTSADNIMGESNIEEMLVTLINNPEAGLVYSDYAIINENGDRLRNS